MPVGKKLFVAASVLATGAGAALFFRKDASTAVSWPSALDESPFRQRVERRVANDAAWGKPSASAQVETVGPAFGLPTAEAAAVRPQAELAPTFQRTMSPVGAMLEPIRELPVESVGNDARPSGTQQGYSEGQSSEHRIADGDTLIKLAEKYLGHSDRYLEIYDLNREVLRNPDLLPIGVTLKIPSRDASPEWKTSTQDSAWAPATGLVPVDRHAGFKRPAGGAE